MSRKAVKVVYRVIDLLVDRDPDARAALQRILLADGAVGLDYVRGLLRNSGSVALALIDCFTYVSGGHDAFYADAIVVRSEDKHG